MLPGDAMGRRSTFVSVKPIDDVSDYSGHRRRIFRGTSAPSLTRRNTSANAMKPRTRYSFIIGFIDTLIGASTRFQRVRRADARMITLPFEPGDSGRWANGRGGDAAP